MTFQEIINHRRSVRQYKDTPIDAERVKHCLELASLSPNSSNMQLWEFYHITNSDTLKKLAVACLNQQSAKTANQMVVFVTRQDLYRKRTKMMIELESQNVLKNSPKEKQPKRVKTWELYYGKVIPILYSRFFGILGIIRKLLVSIVGLFRPITYQVSECDVRVVVHKTCPMEGLDSRRIKKILNLPHGAEINMVISCGLSIILPQIQTTG